MPFLGARLPSQAAGFTLVELMVTLTVLAIMSTLAVPSFQVFMAENRGKAKAMELAAAIKAAQQEAVQRNRQVVLVLTASARPTVSLAGSAQGTSWASVVLPLEGSSDDANPAVIQVGGFSDGAADVRLDASSAGLCFLPDGTLKANAATGIASTACTVHASTGVSVRVYPARGSKVWQVSVTPMGKVSGCLGTQGSDGVFSCA